MNISINRRELVEGLREVLGPTTTKQGIPALNSVLLCAQKEKLKLTTTDLDVTIINLIKAEIEEPGKILVPMRRFVSIVKEFSSDTVTLEKAKNNLNIRCGKAEFKINTIKTEEFPQKEEGKDAVTVKILPETLEEMIGLTYFCIGQEDVNYVLSGILFEIKENKINLVATDGKRLSYVNRDLPLNQAEVKQELSFILPGNAVAEIAKLTKNKQELVYLSFFKNDIEFDFKKTKIICRQIEGEFPSYAQYIPQEKGNQLEVNREDFIAVLRRISLLTTPEHRGVKLNFKKNKVIVYKATPQLGEAKEELEVKYQGQPLEIEFNPGYLLDVLRQITAPEVNFEFFGSEKPAVLKEKDYVYLLLPIKT